MGDVYLAVAEGIEGFNKLLVVKELRRQEDDDELHLAMFMDEARLAARLNHPHIVQTLEVDSDGPRRFMVMEYLEGQQLQRVLRRHRKTQGPFPASIYLGVLANILDALAYVHGLTGIDGHRLGIVHRDVSPQNVFVTYEGHVKLIDFGIAKTQVSSQQTSVGMVKGKIHYMAPEQARGGSVDLRTDIFSVGMMLWDALVGRGPWEGQSDVQILHCLMTGAVPRLHDQRHGLPAELVAVVDRAISPSPDDRYPSAAAMRDELLRHLGPSQFGDYSRTLGEIVSRTFSPERLELRAVVDAQLRAAAGAPPYSFASLTRVRTGYGETSQPSVVSRTFDEEAEPSISIVHPSTPAANRATTGRPPRRGTVVVAAMAAGATLALVGLAIVLTFRGHDRGVSALVAPSTSGMASAPGTPETPLATSAPSSRTVHVIVRVLPPGARLTVDDVVVSNPYVADLPLDDSTHTLTAEGPNLVGRTRTFKTTRDTELEISLDRAPLLPRAPWKAPDGRDRPLGPPPVATASTKVEFAPSPTPEMPSANHPRRPREMDKENPYTP
jgi:serine/threonine protein kinase